MTARLVLSALVTAWVLGSWWGFWPYNDALAGALCLQALPVRVK